MAEQLIGGRTEHTVAVPVPRVLAENVEVVRSAPRVAGQLVAVLAEHAVEVPVLSQSLEDIAEVVFVPQRVHRIAEQMVEVSKRVPQRHIRRPRISIQDRILPAP